MQQERYEQAYLETLKFSRPTVFGEPLTKAATFGQLGRVENIKIFEACNELPRFDRDFDRIDLQFERIPGWTRLTHSSQNLQFLESADDKW